MKCYIGKEHNGYIYLAQVVPREKQPQVWFSCNKGGAIRNISRSFANVVDKKRTIKYKFAQKYVDLKIF